jgi:SNF2 family DNA or RNA helicase
MESYMRFVSERNIDFKEHQYDGVQWIINNEIAGVNGFIADEMGLGKTILMASTFVFHPKVRTLIIVPPILIQQWATEIVRITGKYPLIFHGPKKKMKDDIEKASIVISTYGICALKECPLHQISWSRIVFDEGHHLRNKNSRYHGAMNLNSEIIWIISGTPIQNKKSDFTNLCKILRIEKFDGSQMLRRTKKEIGIGLPSLNFDSANVSWKENERQLSQDIHESIKYSSMKIQTFIRARQACILPSILKSKLDDLKLTRVINEGYDCNDAVVCSSKIDAVISTILSRKNNCGKLIFCHFRDEIDIIRRRLSESLSVGVYDGRNKSKNKLLEKRFDVLILQIQTGCEGLNLQKDYSEIYFVSPHWNPSVEDQAVGRCYRIGQTKPVYVFRFEMEDFESDEYVSMDHYISDMHSYKRNICYELLG